MTSEIPPHCSAAPSLGSGDATLYLRGTMNNWTALDDYEFQYSCDAYYLNVQLQGPQEFKIADAAWGDATTFGAARRDAATPALDQPLALGRGNGPGGATNLNFAFDGEQTIRLAFVQGKPLVSIGPKRFVDPSHKPVTDPVALSLRFDSRRLADKSPFGAVPAGTAVDFALEAAPGVTGVTLVIEKRRVEGNQDLLEYTEVARVPLRKHRQQGSVERWSARHRFNDVSVYGYYFEAQIAGKTYVYENNRDTVHWTREKGSNGLGLVEEKPLSNKRIRRYRHTVYAADFRVPAWARDVVYYYIFPDRFRNGDLSNDPRPGVDRYQ
ncbi:MAG TPA: hypothetical protein VFV25_13160, partial [Methylibium sp.]